MLNPPGLSGEPFFLFGQSLLNPHFLAYNKKREILKAVWLSGFSVERKTGLKPATLSLEG